MNEFKVAAVEPGAESGVAAICKRWREYLRVKQEYYRGRLRPGMETGVGSA